MASPADPPVNGWTFLIWAPPYTHRSSGIRALYRLCHHLNTRGFPTAVVAGEGEPLPGWNCFHHSGPVADSIVVYPEVVPGNPLAADRVVRWVLNSPGLLGGDKTYADSEMVFVYDLQKLPDVNRALSTPIGPRRQLWLGLVDPDVIYSDPAVPRDLICTFTHKGAHVAQRIAAPDDGPVTALESLTTDMGSLGDVLRRTRTLYSYDHYSNVLREAVISGCDVRVPDSQGHWHDPRTCDCELNIHWHSDIETVYRAHFHSDAFVADFIAELRTRWDVPRADPSWAARLPFPPPTSDRTTIARRLRSAVARLRSG